jgi:hypothetical protein
MTKAIKKWNEGRKLRLATTPAGTLDMVSPPLARGKHPRSVEHTRAKRAAATALDPGSSTG